MNGMALIFLVLYGGVGTGLRMFIQWRVTGKTGFHGLKGRVGSVDWFAEVLLVIAILGIAVSMVITVFGAMQPLSFLDLAIEHTAGVALFTSGFALTFVAQMKMGRSWRIGVDQAEHTQLVTNGLFSWMRNPIYTAMILAFLGLVLMVPTLLAVCSWGLLIASLHLQVRFVEEPYLLRIHGENYANYACSVSRFIPGGWARHSRTAKSF